ncbi:unnamed protein product, partial [Nesidiocoris tenuis]
MGEDPRPGGGTAETREGATRRGYRGGQEAATQQRTTCRGDPDPAQGRAACASGGNCQTPGARTCGGRSRDSHVDQVAREGEEGEGEEEKEEQGRVGKEAEEEEVEREIRQEGRPSRGGRGRQQNIGRGPVLGSERRSALRGSRRQRRRRYRSRRKLHKRVDDR